MSIERTAEPHLRDILENLELAFQACTPDSDP